MVHVADDDLHRRQPFAGAEDARPAVLVGFAVLLEERDVAELALRIDQRARHLEGQGGHRGCVVAARSGQLAQPVGRKCVDQRCRSAFLVQAANVSLEGFGDCFFDRLIERHGPVPALRNHDSLRPLVAPGAKHQAGDAFRLIGIKPALNGAVCDGDRLSVWAGARLGSDLADRFAARGGPLLVPQGRRDDVMPPMPNVVAIVAKVRDGFNGALKGFPSLLQSEREGR
ncbi:hypothetical protein D4Q71_15340 [Rhodopseudomonas palustris]|nr:hypothetical protein B1S06_16365 [Rhodopseudomonas palustris]RJF63176.1 hypothetical protein D4Q71_15340 [Rhodopseudomonas palustris]